MYNLTENLGNLTESIDLISWGSGVGGGGGVLAMVVVQAECQCYGLKTSFIL